LCAARTIAGLSAAQGAPALDMVPCPKPPEGAKLRPDVASISEDGEYLFLSSTEQSSTCGRVRIDALIAPNDQSLRLEPFDTVAVLRPDGTALYVPETASSVRLGALKSLKEKPQESSAVLTGVELGGQSYRAFLQPMKLKVLQGKDAAELLVAGFIAQPRFDKATTEIRLSSYLWVVLLLALGILSLPMAKLWLLGPYSSFTRFDVTLLVTSALTAALLSVILLFSFVAHNMLWERSERQAESTAKELERQLRGKLSKIGGQLADFSYDPDVETLASNIGEPDEGTSSGMSEACRAYGHGDSLTSALFEGDSKRWPMCERTYFVPPQPGTFNVAFLSNSRGFQQAKLVPGAHASAPISVANRGYFRRAMTGDIGCLDELCATQGTAEVVRSATSSKMVLIAAQASTDQEGNVVGVLAVENPLDELANLVLPLGVQAAVIDRDGRVMMHSDNEAAHGQELFADLDRPIELRAAVANDAPESLELRYLGVPSRIHVRPVGLRGLGWSLLVMTPQSIVDVATTDMVLTSLFAFVALIAFAVLTVCLGLLVHRVIVMVVATEIVPADARQPVSLRPHRSRSRDYASVGLRMLVLSGALISLTLLLGNWLPTTLLLLLSAFVAWAMLAKTPGIFLKAAPGWKRIDEYLMNVTRLRKHLDRARDQHQHNWRDSLTFTYTLCCVGLVSVFIVVPATVIFCETFDQITETLVRAEQLHLTRKVGKQPGCLAPAVDTEPDADCRLTVPSRQQLVLASGNATSLASCFGSPLRCLADYLPPVGSTEHQALGRLYHAGRQPRFFPFFDDEEAPVSADYQFPRSGSELRIVAANMPPLSAVHIPGVLGPPFGWGRLVVLFLVFAGFFGGALAVAFFSMKRLFFMRQLQHGSSTTKNLVAQLSEPGTKSVVLFPGPRLESELRQLGFGEDEHRRLIVVLESAYDNAALAQQIGAARSGSETVVVLASIDLAQRAPAEHRDMWLKALKDFKLFREQAPLLTDEAGKAALLRAWLDSDDRERRALAQLTLDGYVNPHDASRETIDHLLRRGLLDPDTLTIASPDLKDVIAGNLTAQERQRWSDADQGSAWHALRAPLSSVVVALFGAVTISKPELGMASALVPTLAAGLPTVLRVLLQMVTTAKPSA
jgi:hypothetical protein